MDVLDRDLDVAQPKCAIQLKLLLEVAMERQVAISERALRRDGRAISAQDAVQ
jgi:hypothetical protein